MTSPDNFGRLQSALNRAAKANWKSFLFEGILLVVLGIALLIVTSAIYILGRNRIRTNAEGFSSAPGGG